MNKNNTLQNLVNCFFSENKAQISLFEDTFSLNKDEIYIGMLNLVNKFTDLNLSNKARIVVLMPRGVLAAVTIYAILSHGYTYVPIDISSPSERIKYVVKDSGAELVISISENFNAENMHLLKINSDIFTPNKLIVKNSYDPIDVNSEDIAAILYTSGSTGAPKGIALSHRAMFTFIKWMSTAFSVSSNECISNLAPFNFDLSVFDLFVILFKGGKLKFIPQSLTMYPFLLTRWLNENKITVWYTVPSILSFWGRKGGLNKVTLPDLRLILFAGEIFPLKHLLNLVELLPETQFYNLYGPTETNVCCYWPIDRNRLSCLESIPIGYPASEATLKINTESNTLLVKGKSIFSGYLKDGKITQKISHDNWYDTGDVVSIGTSGEYYYHGRVDRMLKINGYRIEPAEIEYALNNFESIIESVVLDIKDQFGENNIIACIYANFDLDQLALKTFLKERLPNYMLPNKYFILKNMPRLLNGKIDLVYLREMVKEKYGKI